MEDHHDEHFAFIPCRGGLIGLSSQKLLFYLSRLLIGGAADDFFNGKDNFFGNDNFFGKSIFGDDNDLFKSPHANMDNLDIFESLRNPLSHIHDDFEDMFDHFSLPGFKNHKKIMTATGGPKEVFLNIQDSC